MSLFSTPTLDRESPSYVPGVLLLLLWPAVGLWFGWLLNVAYLGGLPYDEFIRYLAGWFVKPAEWWSWNRVYPTVRVTQALSALLLILAIPAVIQWRFKWASRWTEIAFVSFSFLVPLGFFVGAWAARSYNEGGSSGIQIINQLDRRSVSSVISYALTSCWANRFFLALTSWLAILFGLTRFVMLVKKRPEPVSAAE